MATTTLKPRDIFVPQVLTTLVEVRVDEDTAYDITDLAPLVTVGSTRVKMNVRSGTLARIGQFRADNAQTPIAQPQAFQAESVEMEIPLLSEKEVVREDVLRRLRSADEGLAREAMDRVVDQGAGLRQRNINLSKLMVWRAAQDILSITYPNGTVIDIDYGLENADAGMSATHLPNVSGTTPWSNPATDLQANVDAWSTLIVDDAGVAQTDLTMWISTTIWRYMQGNTALMEFAGSAAAPVRPTLQQAADFLGIREIRLHDQPYKDLADVTQKYLPINKVILKADAAPGGNIPIIQLLDGPVVRYENGELVVGNNPGAVTDMWAMPDPPVQNIRTTTARVPLVIREGIVAAQVA